MSPVTGPVGQRRTGTSYGSTAFSQPTEYRTEEGVCRHGCVYGTHSPSTPAPGWQRVRFLTNVSYPGAPAITAGLTVDSISIDFDEGTDIGPDFSGMVVLDNIDVNGVLIGAPGES